MTTKSSISSGREDFGKAVGRDLEKAGTLPMTTRGGGRGQDGEPRDDRAPEVGSRSDEPEEIRASSDRASPRPALAFHELRVVRSMACPRGEREALRDVADFVISRSGDPAPSARWRRGATG